MIILGKQHIFPAGHCFARTGQSGSMIQARVEVVRPCQVGRSSLAVLFLLSTEHG
jgi:hypothetical protein